MRSTPADNLTQQSSSSLADLAARIRVEHEAAVALMKHGLERAINAGNLMIEAKAQLQHGQWLPWLAEHCEIPERTAQAYMQVARSFAKLDDDKSATVADLSFRDALHSLAATGSILKRISPESYDRALQSVQERDQGDTWRQALQRVRIEDAQARNAGMLDTPRSMLPPPRGRKIRIARNPALRQWMLAIGPDITRAALKEKEQAAGESETVRELEQERSELLDRAAALEAEAKALRADAVGVGDLITAEVKNAIGPVAPFTETYDFQCDEQTDAELAALPQHELVDVLLAAKGTVGDRLEEIVRGYWGDMSQMSSQRISPGPGGPRSKGWTKIGSPEWLDQLFPNWNASNEHDVARAAAAAAAEEQS